MDLVERYIAAIKFWLPAKSRDDIAAELAEDIRCEIEETERQKGRKLSEDEVSDLLKERGAPVAVASRYLPQRSLIGPEIMPVYLFVLKIVATICLAPLVIAWIAAPYVRDNVFGQLLMAPASSLLTAFAVVTIIFAVIEHNGIIPAKTQNWNPQTLPPVIQRGRIKRSDSIGDIIGSIVIVWLFFAGYLSRNEYWGFDSHIVLSPQWVSFWQIILVLVLAETALASVNLFRPVWTTPKILLRLAIDLAKTGAFYWLLQSNPLRNIESSNASPIAIAKCLDLFSILVRFAAPIMGLVAVLVVLTALWRLYRVARQHSFVKASA